MGDEGCRALLKDTLLEGAPPKGPVINYGEVGWEGGLQNERGGGQVKVYPYKKGGRKKL